jgi:hypothetical protein
MPDASEIGVLLLDNDTAAQIGLIKFDPSGVLVYQTIKTGLHVYAFKPINKLLSEEWLKEPLYIKHAELLAENPKLPNDVLEQEADSCAEFLNSLANQPTLGDHIVKAHRVHFGSKDG